MSAVASPRRRRIALRNRLAQLCSGSPRTPRGRTPVRVVTISVLSPDMLGRR